MIKNETDTTMLAKDIMSTQRFVRWHMTANEVVNKIFAYGLPGLPVVNDDMNVMGVITEFNIVGAIYEGMDLQKITAQRIMTKEPVTAEPETPISKLAETILNNSYSIIPIVNKNRLVGVVSKHMMLDAHLAPYICKRVTMF